MSDLSPAAQRLIEQTEVAAPRQKTAEFTRYGEGLCFASVCTSLSDEDAVARMNEMPSGTKGGWQISEEAFQDGTPNGAVCPDHPDTHRHLLFEA